MPTPKSSSVPTPETLAGSGLHHPGLAVLALLVYQSNANIHREIVRQGRFEFLLQSARRNDLGLTPRDVRWIFAELVRTKPLEVSEMPNGTILDERGHIVPPTKDDLRTAEAMGLHVQTFVAKRTPRVFLG
jgi:hypothetical protein